MDVLHAARQIVLGAAALGLLGGAIGCDDPAPTPELHGQIHLTLLHTADIHSRLFPYNLQLSQVDAGLGLGANGSIINTGGVARVSHIIGRERARADRVLHLDGGDCFQGAPVFNFFSGEPEVRALGAMGSDASLVANHEFDRGANNLGLQLQKWATFPVLAANYLFDDPSLPGASPLGSIVKPFTVFNLEGLKVGVIGMGNLSSLTSIFNRPNRLGITPLDTTETAQFYVDLLRPEVDVVIVLSHLGLDVDEQMIQSTSGIDIVLGGHNHIVLQPPKQLQDCSGFSETDTNGVTQHFILLDAPGSGEKDVGCHSKADCASGEVCVGSAASVAMGQGLCKAKRACTPRNVLLTHSGAFAKYVGRLDLVVSNAPQDLPSTYDKLDGFEVVTHDYQLLPVSDQTPEDPVVDQMLQPYAQHLDAVGNLDLLVGYALDGSKRNATGRGDSPLGNLIADAMWLRLGIQTDFSLTNTTGIRADLLPGPVTVEQMFNIFPFDNSITKMSLSGVEVQQLFDYVAQRSSGRGCASQVQIAGARVVLNCTQTLPFDQSQGNAGQATNIYIGTYDPPIHCSSDTDCPHPVSCHTDADCPGSLVGRCNVNTNVCANPNQCDVTSGACWQPVVPLASYQLATSDYLSHGGSGFLVLQRNTTQSPTFVQQRDAVIDFMRAGFPCGADTSGQLRACSTDADCANPVIVPGEIFACACPEAVIEGAQCTTAPKGCGGKGQCVLAQCRDDVAAFQSATCQSALTGTVTSICLQSVPPCVAGGETCKFLTCVDQRLGNVSDNRIQMVGQ